MMEKKNWKTLDLNDIDCLVFLTSSNLQSKALLSIIQFCSSPYKNNYVPNSVSSSKCESLDEPALIDKNNQIYHSGLCVCSRIIVERYALKNQNRTLKRFLGLKSGLLKGYESRCDWRFAFERKFPYLIAQFQLDKVNAENELRAACLAMIENVLTAPAWVFNAHGLAKRLHRECSKNIPMDADINTNLETNNVADVVKQEKWYLKSKKFQTIIQSNLIPSLFCFGLDPTIIDCLAFFYINEMINYVGNIFSDDAFPQIKRWLVLFIHTFQNTLIENDYYDINCLKRLLEIDNIDYTLDYFIPDTQHVEVPDQINQGRWLPRGGKRSNLVNIVKEALGDLLINKPHPALEWMIDFNWSGLPFHCDVANYVPKKRGERKRQQILNIVSCCLLVCKPGDTIVDFCSGGGHVGLLLGHLLPDCKIVLIDNKLESLLEAEKRIKSGLVKNVELYHCSLEQYVGDFDVGVCLHACGPSTDIVLSMCYKKKASFVVCPCCYGSIRFGNNTTNKDTEISCDKNSSYPKSELFKSKDISVEEFFSLTKGADNSGDDKQREDCMNIVDIDRIEESKQLGYTHTLLTKMEPSDCSPKNNIIIGSRVPFITSF